MRRPQTTRRTVAHCRAPANREAIKREAFSLVELIVVMGVIALLLAMALPAVTRSRETARRIQCQSNLRNIAFALTEFDNSHHRLPASGYHYDKDGVESLHHSWAVSILPWVDQSSLYNQWQLEKPITDPVNRPLAQSRIPVYICPLDISRSPKGTGGDLSYVVNGGGGVTVRLPNGVADCPVDRAWTPLDLNGNGVACSDDPAENSEPSDRTYFKRMGLFFLENWKCKGTVRHHALAGVKDGLSQTFLLAENIRAGYDPLDPTAGFASPNPYRCAFYIGNPCRGGPCVAGSVDYSLCNTGVNGINSGRQLPEGRSPVPNSFHFGGVSVAFADGHAGFLSESIDGHVYAALASPQGTLLEGSALQQTVSAFGER